MKTAPTDDLTPWLSGGSDEKPRREYARLTIPPGTQPDTVFRMKGEGITDQRRRAVGDMHVRVKVAIPTRLNGTQKELLRKYAETEGLTGFDKKRGLFRH